MGIITQQVTIKSLRERRVVALIDTGADLSFIRPDIAQSIGAAEGFTIPVKMPGGRWEKASTVEFHVKIRNRYVSATAAVYPIGKPLILGVDFLQANKAFIRIERDKIVFTIYAPKIARRVRI